MTSAARRIHNLLARLRRVFDEQDGRLAFLPLELEAGLFGDLIQGEIGVAILVAYFGIAGSLSFGADARYLPSMCREVVRREVCGFTTLQKASLRLLASTNARRLLDATTQLRSSRRRRVHTAAIDSTGLECTCASGYFIKRRVRATEPWKTVVYHRYAKLGVVCDTSDHFILAYQVGRGPRPDTDEFRPLVAEALRRVCLSRVVADAGYDSEANHVFARDQNRLRSAIPAKFGRPTAKPARGRYRRLMQTRFDSRLYCRRAQVETVMSMIKRRQGSYVRGRSYWSQCRDLHLLALTHNIMILLWIAVFYRAISNQF